MPGSETRVLWIDDELRTTMKFLVSALRFSGFRIDTAEYLKEALDLLNQYREGRARPGIVLLDVMMPVRENDAAALSALGGQTDNRELNSMTAGILLIERIAATLPKVPILALTNLSEETEIGQHGFDLMRQHNAITRIESKPVTHREILSLIRGMLEVGSGDHAS